MQRGDQMLQLPHSFILNGLAFVEVILVNGYNFDQLIEELLDRQRDIVPAAVDELASERVVVFRVVLFPCVRDHRRNGELFVFRLLGN